VGNEESVSFLGSEGPLADAVGRENRLRRGALGILDIPAATMANIGPAMS
jgi:hypothetical protein